jgi:hypothetical protein
MMPGLPDVSMQTLPPRAVAPTDIHVGNQMNGR